MNDWKEITLDAVSDKLVRGPFGGSLKKEIFVQSGYRVYEQQDAIYGENAVARYFITEDKYNELWRFSIEGGDFLVSCSGTIGRIYRLPIGSEKGIINQALLKITLNETVISPEYFLQYFRWSKFQNAIIDDTQGGAMKNLVGMDKFKETVIPLPLLPEQQAIAEVLSDTDSYISSLEKLIEKKLAVKQGAMQELLTGKKRLPGFSGECEYVEFGTQADILRGGSPRPIQAYLTTKSDGINWIKIGDVAPNAKYICSTEERIIPEGVAFSRSVNKGDFILSNSMSFGRPYILNINGCIHDGWLTIQNYQTNFDIDFLYYLLGSEETIQQYINMAAGSSVQNLNKDKVQKLVVLKPSKPEQTAIAEILSDMDEEIDTLTAKLNKAKLIKQGMMQKLLTGEIRLIKEKN